MRTLEPGSLCVPGGRSIALLEGRSHCAILGVDLNHILTGGRDQQQVSVRAPTGQLLLEVGSQRALVSGVLGTALLTHRCLHVGGSPKLPATSSPGSFGTLTDVYCSSHGGGDVFVVKCGGNKLCKP